MLLTTLAALAVIPALAYPPRDSPAAIRVEGAVVKPLLLRSEDMAKMPRATVQASSHGVETSYEGVWLHEILKAAGVPQGAALRGKALSSYVVASAEDGYQVVFSLGELDPEFGGTNVLVADSMLVAKGGKKPLTGASMGIFRLILANDKHGSRSLRMLNRIEVVQLRK